jgi:hypothetical protein
MPTVCDFISVGAEELVISPGFFRNLDPAKFFIEGPSRVWGENPKIEGIVSETRKGFTDRMK